jgi:PAS domain S-box-containing protein
MKKYLFYFFILILFSATTLSIALSDDEIPAIRVGVYENIPKIFTNEEGIVSGFWPDLVKYIFEQEDWRIEWVAGTWTQCLKRLKTGEINIMPDTGWTQLRSREYTFSNETVLVSWSRLYVPKKSKINAIIDLNGKTIAGLKGSFNLEGPEGLRQLLYKFNLKATIKEMESYEQVFEVLEEGKIDAGITNKDFGNLNESDYAVKRTSIIFQPARMQFAFTKNSDLTSFLKEKIDVHMEKLKGDKNSIYYQALEQYIGGKPSRTFIKIIPEWIKTTLAIGCGVILFLVAVGIASRRQVRRRTFELQESERKLSIHLQNTPVGAISWDLDFKNIEWNPAAESIFGYSKVEAMGKHVTELILPGDMKELVDGIFQDLISEKGGAHSTNENITKDGDRIICDWFNTTLKDTDGNVIGVASLVQEITERKETLEALKKQKEFSEKIVQTSRAIIIGLDKDHKIKIFNRGAEEITGYQSQEVIGKDWFEIFVKPDIYDEIDGVWEDAWGAKFNSYVNPIQVKNGSEKIISWQTTGMYDSADETKHMLLSIGEDLTERIQAEEALKESEEKYRRITENAQDMIYRMSLPDGHYEYVSPASLDLVGYPPEKFYESSVLIQKIIHPDWTNYFKEQWTNLVNGNMPPFYEYQIIHKSGEQKWVNQRNVLICDDNGQAKAIEAVMTDVTQHKKIEEELRESEEKYRHLFQNAPAGIYEIDFEKVKFINVNEVMCKYSGYSEKEFLALNPLDLLTEDSKNLFIGRLEKFSTEENRVGSIEYNVITKAGQKLCVLLNNDYIYKNGKLTGSRVVVHDITQLKKAQEEKIKAQKIAGEQKRLALVGQVAGKMAHDFNNILGIIMGNTELSMIDCKEEETKKTLELIFEQTIRGKNLTRNLVAFAKDQEPKQEFFRISEKIDLILNLMKKDLQGIELIRENKAGVTELLADPGMIEHTFVNLIQNSIHAVSLVEHPIIISRIYTFDDNICIEIEDNGCGIPKKHLVNIFEPSFTLKGSKDTTGSYGREIKGTGYGMANVKKYIEQHKGNISVESAFGSGTKFTISLPVIKKELTSQEKAEIQQENIYFDKYILLVEDEPAISGIQYKILSQEPCNHKVDIAHDGQIAMDLFKRNKYDLISLDYILPGGINGMDVYDRVRKINKTIPILFISGNIEFLESIKELKRKDANIDHLSKPSQNKDYVKSINELFTRNLVPQE